MLLSGEWSQRELGIIQELLKNNRPWNCTWFCLVFINADSPVDKYNIYDWYWEAVVGPKRVTDF